MNVSNCSYGVMTKIKGDLNGLLSYYGMNNSQIICHHG